MSLQNAQQQVYANDVNAVGGTDLAPYDAQAATTASDIVTAQTTVTNLTALLASYSAPEFAETTIDVNQNFSLALLPVTIANGTAKSWITWNPAAGVAFQLNEAGTYWIGFEMWARPNGVTTSQLYSYVRETPGVASALAMIMTSANHASAAYYTQSASVTVSVAANQQFEWIRYGQPGISVNTADHNRLWVVKMT